MKFPLCAHSLCSLRANATTIQAYRETAAAVAGSFRNMTLYHELFDDVCVTLSVSANTSVQLAVPTRYRRNHICIMYILV